MKSDAWVRRRDLAAAACPKVALSRGARRRARARARRPRRLTRGIEILRSVTRRSRPLADDEVKTLLELDVPARLATLDRDGYPRVVPIWFLWTDGAFHMTSLRDRIHVLDIRRDPRAAICIDIEDRRSRRNSQIRGRGIAELLPEHAEWTRRITRKYVLGPDAAREAERRAAMDRVLIRLRPERLVRIGTPDPWPPSAEVDAAFRTGRHLG